MIGVKITPKAVERALSELVSERIIVVWQAGDGAMWLEIRDFDEGQTEQSIENRPARVAPPRPDDDDESGALVTPGGKPSSPKDATALDAKTSDAVQRVFDHWAAGEKATGGIKKPLLTPDRRTRIRVRLDDGFTVEQLCACIDGFHVSPFHLGENDRGTRYTDLMTMLKSAQQVDTGIQRAEQHRGGHGPTGRSSLVNPQSGLAYQ